jgi:hypothetical protein
MRQVDLGPDLVAFGAAGTRSPAGATSFALRLEVGTHFDRFMFLDRTGMSFLLGHAHDGEYIENRFAFDFQFPGQVIDSNLAHPPSISSGLSR